METDNTPTEVQVNSPHNMAVLVGKALRQRLLGGPLLDRGPDGKVRVAPDVDDNPGDPDLPYWLQDVSVGEFDDESKPGAAIYDAYGNAWIIKAHQPNKISDPDGIMAKAFIQGWKDEGANEERRHIDWLLGEAEECVRSLGNSVMADRIALHRFTSNPYDPSDVADPRPEDS